MKPKAKKKAKKTPMEKILDKIKKELLKLENLHEKEDAIMEKINDLVDEAQEDDEYDFDKWEGTNGD
tara:strand:+ start:212 stop:412 length:201 start_codon:yes stop_codon:yes gene_type:complete